MKNNEISKANRKALPRFLLIIAVSAVIGWLIGYVAAKYGLNEITGSLKAAGAFFGAQLAPWLMLLMAVILPAVAIPIYHRAKRQASLWDGEDEEISDAIEKKLSIALWLANAVLILAYFLLAASYSAGLATFDSTDSTILLFIGLASFLGIMAEVTVITQKCVDASKQINPEKKASVYDMKFQKKWMDECDEAEKMIIGRCAFKAFSVTNKTCTVSAAVLAVCALFFDTGLMPSLVVCLIWIVSQSVYHREAMRYSKAGNKIS